MVDLVILLILAIALLAGYYRGVIYSAINLGVSILSFVMALLLCTTLSSVVQKRQSLYEMMLYYFEGYEYINETSVELVHVSVSQIGEKELAVVVKNADMPSPFDSAITGNVKKQVYEDRGIYSLGDYFNQTIVDTVLNIISLLLLFLIFRLLFGFVLRLIDFGAAGLPRLKQFDVPLACGIGLLHGVLLVSVLFMFVPLMLVVVPRLSKFIDGSLLGGFFYRGNVLLRMVPTV